MSGGYRNPKQEGNSLTTAEILWVQTGAAGVLLLPEQTSAPTATPGVGKIYTKSSDNHLYYLNDSGVEVQIDSGGVTGTQVYGEDLSAQTPGTSLTVLHAPIVDTTRLYRGGARQRVGDDYTFFGTTITLSTAFVTGEVLLIDYNY